MTSRGFIERHGLVQYKHGLDAKYPREGSCEIGICRAYGIEVGTGQLVHDHCHAHGWVRGLVCVPCNNRVMHISQDDQHDTELAEARNEISQLREDLGLRTRNFQDCVAVNA